jgi:hypothetical protein
MKMSHNLKVLGLALAAMLALSAVAAQGAFAEPIPEYFHSHAKHIIITGEQHPQFPNQETVLNNNAGEQKGLVVCKKLSLRGDQEGEFEGTVGTWTSKFATVHPEYSECEAKAPLNEAATVSVPKGCHYKLTATTQVTTPGQSHGKVHIICPKTEPITISTPVGCKITVTNEETPAGSGEFGQTPTHGNVYTNVNTDPNAATNKKEITAHATVKGIKFTSSFACQLAGIPASGEKAEYNGTTTTRCFKYVSGTTETGYTEGEQVGCWKE